jgi:hypothetical protein
MRSAAECREHAKECHALAMSFAGERRQQTLDMAQTWENLAREVDTSNSRHLSGAIRATYDRFAHEPVPQVFRDLLGRLDAAEARVGSIDVPPRLGVSSRHPWEKPAPARSWF